MPGVRRKTSASLTKTVEPPVDRAIAELARRQHGVVALAHLTALGLSPAAVRMRTAAGRLHRIHRGVYAVGHPRLTRRGARMAAVLAAGPGAVLSHRDAAALWDLSPFSSGSIHVTVSSRGGRSHRNGLVVHRSRLHPEDREEVDEVPVTAVPRTLLDLAEIAAPTQLRRTYERAERLELLDTTALQRLLARSTGRRGLTGLRELLAYDPTAAAGADSELEHLFCDLLRSAGLPMAQTNVLVEGLLVDAFWPEARLVVELDGFRFHQDRAAFERDRARDTRLKRAGYEVVRFTYRQLASEPELVLATVRELLSRRGGAFAH